MKKILITAYILLILLIVAVSLKSFPYSNLSALRHDLSALRHGLKIVYETKINVLEPSGLTLSSDGKNLWTISDENSCVYLLSFEGKILKSFEINAKDLEGITTINDSTIAVISELSSKIIFLSINGKELFRKQLFISSRINNGLEGIAYNKNNKHTYIVNEKNPTLLIEYDSLLNEVKRIKLDFAKDLSGLDYIEENNELWIISDESKLIAKCTIGGKVKESYSVNIQQIEGIAVDVKSKRIYLVSDKEEKLYILEIK